MMWRNGQALRPYFEDVKSIARKKDMFNKQPYRGTHPIAEESNYSFVHFPIRDCSVTDDDRVIELCYALVKSISENQLLYLHCWGGHGRTGTIVSIMLYIMYGVRQFLCSEK